MFRRATEFIHDQRTAADGASIHVCRRFVVQRLVRALAVVKGEIRRQPDHQFAHRGVALQIHVFMLDAAPQPLDKDVVERAPLYSAKIADSPIFNVSMFDHAKAGTSKYS